jgi:hypothetical protein
MASKKLSSDTSLANSYKLSRGVASVARPSAPTIGTATDTGSGAMSVTFTASTLGPTASSYTLTSSSGIASTGASSPVTLQEIETGTYTYSVYGANANGNGPSSAASNSVVVSSVFANSYESIATTITSTSPSIVTFSSIPQTYQHLQLRYLARRSDAVGTAGISIQLNGDGGANYVRNELYQGNTTASTSSAIGQVQMAVGYMTGSSANAGSYGVGIIDILDYTNTNKNTVVRALTGANNNGAGNSNISTGVWLNTAAVTSFSFIIGGSFVNNSTFTLYGIKG